MSRTLNRVLVAAALSAAVYGATEWWYKHSALGKDGPKNQNPIASVFEVQKNVERRPVTRLIWQSLTDGDPVYPNETIRTGSDSDTTVKIQFEGGKFITLEPDTLVTISTNKNEISLDLLDGSLFVAQAEQPKNAQSVPANPNLEALQMTLTLKSGDKKVDLTQATAQLSKSKGNKVDVQVIKGKATVEEGGQAPKELSAGQKISSFEILAPEVGKPFFFSPEQPEPVLFRWKGLPAKTKVTLWTGKTRKNLSEFRQTLAPNENELTASLEPGKHFWKLVAENGIESAVYKIDVGTRTAPSLLYPVTESDIVKDKGNFIVDFRWTIPDLTQNIMLEIGKDPQLKDKIYEKTVSIESSSFGQALEVGTYYWRASALYQGSNRAVPAKVMRFEVQGQARVKLSPVAVQWINPLETSPQYFVHEPIATWSWKTEQKDQVKSWRLSIAKDEATLREPSSTNPTKIYETMETTYKTTVTEPGKYVAFVEALNAESQVLAKSETKWIEIAALPPLASPEFQPGNGTLQSDNTGRLELNWTKVSGAKEYWLTLYDKSGKEMRKAKFSGNTTALTNLLPGNYKVGIFAVDEHGRESQKQDARTVEVPDKSGLSAPKLKKFKVN
jgi:hypothetical protein